MEQSSTCQNWIVRMNERDKMLTSCEPPALEEKKHGVRYKCNLITSDLDTFKI